MLTLIYRFLTPPEQAWGSQVVHHALLLLEIKVILGILLLYLCLEQIMSHHLHPPQHLVAVQFSERLGSQVHGIRICRPSNTSCDLRLEDVYCEHGNIQVLFGCSCLSKMKILFCNVMSAYQVQADAVIFCIFLYSAETLLIQVLLSWEL